MGKQACVMVEFKIIFGGIYYSANPRVGKLTHWGRDKMDAISQTTFSRAFSSMKIVVFWLNFHWNMFPRVQLTIIQHWFRYWLGAVQATSHYLNQWWLVYWRIYASLGLSVLRFTELLLVEVINLSVCLGTRGSNLKSYYRNDVIMSAIASQITSLTIVYSTIYSGADQRKHQSSTSLAFVRWIHRWIPRTKGQ